MPLADDWLARQPSKQRAIAPDRPAPGFSPLLSGCFRPPPDARPRTSNQLRSGAPLLSGLSTPGPGSYLGVLGSVPVTQKVDHRRGRLLDRTTRDIDDRPIVAGAQLAHVGELRSDCVLIDVI